MQARYLTGLSAFFGRSMVGGQKAVYDLITGPVHQRLGAIILIGEVVGPADALEQLEKLRKKLAEHDIEPTPTQAKLIDVLTRLYRDYEEQRLDAPSVGESGRDLLRQELHWVGELALAPEGGPDPAERERVLALARRTAAGMLAVISMYILLGLAGLAGLTVFIILLSTGKMRLAFRCGSPYGGVYAETFALWMVLFLALGFGAALVRAEGSGLILSAAASVLSLLALGWPVLRGVPWRAVRQDVGLTAGRRPWLEPFLGLAGYVMALPLLGLGLIVTLILLAVQRAVQGLPGGEDYFGPSTQPTHPIIEYMGQASAWDWWQIFLTACVAAPLVEETMFRGVLYRHLREASARWGFALSALCSAVLVSFVFAAIHPQGLATVPTLMGLALGFTLVREWRGTLVPAVVAHGINNGMAMLALYLALGG
jgi:membrane protease YdiL (CAAX protease family)